MSSAFWIDVYSAAGAKLGDGPIITAQSWDSTDRLDRAGSFRFTMPASDPRGLLLDEKCVVKCYTVINLTVTLIGAGIIDKIETIVDNTRKMIFNVSGQSIAHELTYRQVGEYAYADQDIGYIITTFAPSGWSTSSSTANEAGFSTTFADIENTFAGESVLAALVRIAEITNEHFYVTADKKVVWLRAYGSAKIYLASPASGTMTVGEMITGGTSHATGILGEQNDAFLYITGVTGRFVAGETVTGTTSTETATVTAAYNPHSGIRAIHGGDPVPMESNTDICIVRTLRRVNDTTDLVTRVIPYGVGNGDARITLVGATFSESGYTLNTTGNYLKRDAAEVSYGQIERRMNFKDIDNADALASQAHSWLEMNSYPFATYFVDVAKLDTTLTPGSQLSVEYHRWIVENSTNYEMVDIDERKLVIVETTTRVDNRGVRTVSFQFANLPRYAATDVGAMASSIMNANAFYTHTQPQDGSDIGGNIVVTSIKAGSGTDYTEVDANGNMSFVGNATVWDDLRVVPGSFDRPGTSDPTIVAYQPGGSGTTTYLWQFDLTNLASFTVQLPHSYKQGTDIYVHVHWTPGPNGVTENGNKVGWKIDYAWANIGGAFGTMTTADLSDACNGTDHEHNMTPEATIDGHTASKNISSMLICNIKRTDTGTDDTWVGTASGARPMLLEIDFHYEIDTVGSKTQSAK